MAQKRKLPSRTASAIKISTGQKVLIGVALLAGLGAVAAGFASLPGRGCDGKTDGKAGSNSALKSEPCDGKDGKDGKNGKGISTAQYSSSQKPTIQSIQKTVQFVRLYPGMLVRSKATSPSVYYVALDLKKYQFPNLKVFSSWFQDFKGITLIPDVQMAKLQNGGVVRFRPGSTPIKIPSDMSVYTITKGGVLHKIGTEKIAEEYYGPKWNLKVQDVTDVQFTNYIMGDNVSANTKKEYSPATQLAEVTTIDQDLGLK